MPNPFDPGYFETDELRTMGFAHIGENVRIAKNCTIIGLENISVGDGSRIDGFCTIIANGGELRVGRRVHLHTNLVIGCRENISIGDFAAISHGCVLLTATDDFSGKHLVGGLAPEHLTEVKTAPIELGDHVVMGAHCTVVPGVTIGEGAALWAHTLATRDIPAWTVIGGPKARKCYPRSRDVLRLSEGLQHAA